MFSLDSHVLLRTRRASARDVCFCFLFFYLEVVLLKRESYSEAFKEKVPLPMVFPFVFNCNPKKQ